MQTTAEQDALNDITDLKNQVRDAKPLLYRPKLQALSSVI
jgi:hypothetical protein